jgi:hypothetical protein
MNAAALHKLLTDRGFRLEVEGEYVRVTPANRLTPDLRAGILEHKREIIGLVISRREAEREMSVISRQRAAALALEMEQAERQNWLDGYPPYVRRVLDHFIAGPVLPVEDAAAWWDGARRMCYTVLWNAQVMLAKGRTLDP